MKIKSIYIAALLIFIVCFACYWDWFDVQEAGMIDQFLLHREQPDNRISIITVDDESLAKLGRFQDWTRDRYAKVLNILAKGKPAVVGIDIMFDEASKNKEFDKQMAEAIKNVGTVVLPTTGIFPEKVVMTKTGVPEAASLLKPIDILDKVAYKGHINSDPDSDGIVRHIMFSFLYKNMPYYSFSWEIYRQYMKKTTGSYPDDKVVPRDFNDKLFINYVGPPMQVEAIPIYSVLNGDVPPDYFKDRIVLIGPYTNGLQDFFYTPMNHANVMYGVEIHANLIQMYLTGKYKRVLDDWYKVLLLLLLGIAAYFAFKKLSPIMGAVVAVAFILLYNWLARIIYGQGLVLTILYPAIIVAMMYLLMLAYNYIQELLERRRITNVFGKYVAPQVVKEILKGGEEGLRLGGMRRFISVLFVDIRGFTPLSEKCQPEEIVQILNEYLNLTASSIFKYNGTLDKFIGDATMAIFNAPLDLEDHAFRAVLTAWAMKQGADKLKEGLLEKYGRTVQFGIGVNTGYAVVGNIGATFRMDYTAIGDTVNTSARLEANAKPGQILLSQAAYELVKDRVLVTPLGGLKVKGKEYEIPVYQLDGIAEGAEIRNVLIEPPPDIEGANVMYKPAAAAAEAGAGAGAGTGTGAGGAGGAAGTPEAAGAGAGSGTAGAAGAAGAGAEASAGAAAAEAAAAEAAAAAENAGAVITGKEDTDDE